MSERAGRRRTLPPPSAPPFPRAVATWVGRVAELTRGAQLMASETLHLVYGVGGVGKSELVYKLVEEAMRLPKWAEAQAVVLVARPNTGAAHLAAALKSQLGARRKRINFSATGGSAQDDLADIAQALEAKPHIVFLDDLHHIDPREAAEVLGYLSRYVRESRVIAASRVELTLPSDAPPPVVHRLGPLDASATAALVRQVAARLGVAAPDAAQVFRRSGGSPFYVLRELAGDAGKDGGLDDTVRALSDDARRLLLVLASTRGRLSAGDAQTLGGPTGVDVLRELTRQLLVDTSRGTAMVHDLVRDAAYRGAGRRDRSAAHRQLAELHLSHAGDGARPATPADAPWLVEAIHHLVAAGDVDEAWERCTEHYRAIASAGLDHLLLDDLRALADAVDDARDAVALMQVRILVRRSLIAQAADVLGRLSPAARGTLRALRLTGEVAQRRGRLSEAQAIYRQARDLAESPAERFGVALEEADIIALRGHGEQARALLDAALRDHADISPRERARWGWSLALSYLIEERFADSAIAVDNALAAIHGGGLEDLEVVLVMLTVLGRAECDDLGTAEKLLEKVEKAAAGGALREHVGSLYAGVVGQAAGDLATAQRQLERAYGYLTDHGDQVMASIAGYYLARVFVALGDIPAAIEMSGRMSRMAQAAELDTLAAHGRATQAEALLIAGRAPDARVQAEAALAGPWVGAQGWRIANATLSRIAVLDGDLGQARRYLDAAERPRADETSGGLHSLESAARRAAIDLERAGLELHGGDVRVALAAAGRALEHYRRTSRLGMYSRALVARAAALVAAADDAGLIEADALTAEADAVATATGHVRVRARCALLRAAIRVRRGDPGGARGELLNAVHEGVAALDHGEGRSVRAALGEVPMTPGQRGLLAALGLAPGARHRVSARGSVQIVDDASLEAARAAHFLVVEPVRAVITCHAATESRVDRGRPLACELLAALVDADGAVVSAEQLFVGVWGGREYHPLRHRNTVYVAVKRLRQTLKALLQDEREVIETAAGGWRVADGVDIAVVRPVED
ncbi:MAG TPA: winged helix-turn-helix domain-containing protein [Kofleriaceae bacterium]|nr:winged helix-turn-helix domain-containing protein [Kofleriaceae bacterium]